MPLPLEGWCLLFPALNGKDCVDLPVGKSHGMDQYLKGSWERVISKQNQLGTLLLGLFYATTFHTV